MSEVRVKLENCYGIRQLAHVFDFSKDKAQLIYAPNGMMKSSLAQVFKDIVGGNNPKDRHFPDRKPRCEIVDNKENALDAKKILVVGPYERDFRSEKQSTLLVNKELQKEHERIHEEIRARTDELLKALRALSSVPRQKTAAVLTSAFGRDEKELNSLLEDIEPEVINDDDPVFADIVYQELDNPKVAKILDDPQFRQHIAEYIEKYEELMAGSRFFKKGIFNHHNAATIGKQLAKENFFKAEHAVVLKSEEGPREVTDQAQLDALIEEEQEAILNDPELRGRFDKIDKTLNNIAEARRLRDYLEAHRELIPELTDPNKLKQKLWIDYLKSVKPEFETLIKTYRDGKAAISRIADQAKKERTQWERVVEIFMQRFSVPIEMEVANKADTVLGDDALPNLKFTFVDEATEERAVIVEDDLLRSLSTGEQRAYAILNIIFEVEARRAAKQDTVLVLDDIADSFDYKNKYAIVEYLKDIRDTDGFAIIILTHNFDFFRTVAGRLGINRKCCFVGSRTKGKIELNLADYIQDAPLAHFKKNLHANRQMLLAAIPYVRNLVEYCEGQECDDYKTLTQMLHIKDYTRELTTLGLQAILNNRLKLDPKLALDEENLLELIYAQAEIPPADTAMNLENKLVLAIAIRLKAEEFMIAKINDPTLTNNIRRDQTAELVREFRNKFGADIAEEETLKVLDRVNLMTPELIHLNAFMFEPLIDICDHHLRRLYDEVKGLLAEIGAQPETAAKDLAPA